MAPPRPAAAAADAAAHAAFGACRAWDPPSAARKPEGSVQRATVCFTGGRTTARPACGASWQGRPAAGDKCRRPPARLNRCSFSSPLRPLVPPPASSPRGLQVEMGRAHALLCLCALLGEHSALRAQGILRDCLGAEPARMARVAGLEVAATPASRRPLPRRSLPFPSLPCSPLWPPARLQPKLYKRLQLPVLSLTAACLPHPAAAAGGVAASPVCVANPRHPFDAEMDMGSPGWVDLGACKTCDDKNATCVQVGCPAAALRPGCNTAGREGKHGVLQTRAADCCRLVAQCARFSVRTPSPAAP